MSDHEEVKFWNAQDGIRGRDGGPYADEVDARQREVNRARAEGREPDLDNPPPFVGNVIVTSAYVEDNLFSNPSMKAAPGPHEALAQAKVVEDAPMRVDPGFLPVDTRDELSDSDREKSEKESVKLAADPSNVAATSTTSVSAKNAGEPSSTGSDLNAGSNIASARSGLVVTKKSASAKKAASSKSAASKRTSAKK